MTAHRLTLDEGAALTRRVTALSMSVAFVLVVSKAAVWLASGSIALLASTADSGLDLVASGVTFYAVRYAAAPPDAEHRFGHGKAEAFASLLQAGLVFASAALIGRDAIERLLHPGDIQHEAWGVAVMALSILLTGGLISVQTRLLRRTASVAVSADRAHYAADLASNLIALGGIGAAALFSWTGFDALAGLAVGGILLVGAIAVFREASSQLLDRELPKGMRERIIALVTEDPRITGVHQLRTRTSGPVVHLQMHADLDPDMSLITAHQALVAAEKRILKEIPAADILIHPDPRGRAEPHGGAFPEVYDGRVDPPAHAS